MTLSYDIDLEYQILIFYYYLQQILFLTHTETNFLKLDFCIQGIFEHVITAKYEFLKFDP